MILHTVSAGENLSYIAKKYSVSQARLVADNGLFRDNLCTGEELVVQKPTMEALTRGGDTLARIALRYGVKRNSLLSNNPQLLGHDTVTPGVMLAIKYQPPSLGPSSAIGIVDASCDANQFTKALPFLTYAAFMEFTLSGGALTRHVRLGTMSKMARERARQALLGIVIKDNSWLGDTLTRSLVLESMIKNAEAGGYDGLYLLYDNGAADADYCDFIFAARRAMIGRSLLLFTNANTASAEVSDLSDASVLTYGEGLIPREDALREIIEFSDKAESSKVFIELPDFGTLDGIKYERETLVRLARRGARKISTDENTGISEFPTVSKTKAGGKSTAYIPSLDMVMALMRKGHEYGYMGFSFNVSRVPISYLCMFNSLFTRADYNIASSDE